MSNTSSTSILASLGTMSNRVRKGNGKPSQDTVAVGFPPAAKEALVRAAEGLGLSTAGLCREAVKEYLQNHAEGIDAAIKSQAESEAAALAEAAAIPVPAAVPAAPEPAAVPGPPKVAPAKK